VARCIAGDEQAWYQLVGIHGGLVFAVARRAGVPDHACDDIAQTVFAALAAGLQSLRDGQSLPAWLITTTRRESWRWLKARRTSHAEPAELEADAESDDLEQHALLRRGLAQLEDKCRELLQLLYFRGGMEYQQVSQLLGMPVGSIGPTRQRCLARLAQILRNRARNSESHPTRE